MLGRDSRFGFLPLSAATFAFWGGVLNKRGQPLRTRELEEKGIELYERAHGDMRLLIAASMAGFSAAGTALGFLREESVSDQLLWDTITEWRTFETLPLYRAIELFDYPFHKEDFGNPDKLENRMGFAAIMALNFYAWKALVQQLGEDGVQKLSAKAAELLPNNNNEFPVAHLACLWAVASWVLASTKLTDFDIAMMVQDWLRFESEVYNHG